MPVFQSSTFEFDGAGDYHDVRYIRLNNTPNHNALHAKLAALESADAALVAGSGMAAISSTLLSLLAQDPRAICAPASAGRCPVRVSASTPTGTAIARREGMASSLHVRVAGAMLCAAALTALPCCGGAVRSTDGQMFAFPGMSNDGDLPDAVADAVHASAAHDIPCRAEAVAVIGYAAPSSVSEVTAEGCGQRVTYRIVSRARTESCLLTSRVGVG